MKQKSIIPVVAAITVTLFISVTSWGEPVTFYFKGTVDLKDDPDGALGNSLQTGDTFTGLYTFDSSKQDSNILPTVGDYQYSNALFGVNVIFPSVGFMTDSNNVDFLIELCNDHGYYGSDNYLIQSYANVSTMPGIYTDRDNDKELDIYWQLDGKDQNAVTSTDLLLTPPNIQDFNQWGVTINYDGPDIDFHVSGNIDAISTEPLSTKVAELNIFDDILTLTVSEMLPGVSNIVQISTNLLSNSWQNIAVINALTNASCWSHNVTGDAYKGFYRVLTIGK